MCAQFYVRVVVCLCLCLCVYVGRREGVCVGIFTAILCLLCLFSMWLGLFYYSLWIMNDSKRGCSAPVFCYTRLDPSKRQETCFLICHDIEDAFQVFPSLHICQLSRRVLAQCDSSRYFIVCTCPPNVHLPYTLSKRNTCTSVDLDVVDLILGRKASGLAKTGVVEHLPKMKMKTTRNYRMYPSMSSKPSNCYAL